MGILALARTPDPVELREEARLPIVAALDHMLRHSGEVESGLAGHGGYPQVGRTHLALQTEDLP
jgi:hypothetical protein